MSGFTLKEHGITLYTDPYTHVYTVSSPGGEWRITEKPYILFAGGRKVFFPEPVNAAVFPSGTGSVIRAEDGGLCVVRMALKPDSFSFFTTISRNMIRSISLPPK